MLSDYGLITDLKPVCNWFYLQPTKDGDERIPNSGFCHEGHEVVTMIEAFRATNHIPIGNPEGDLVRFIINRSPINDRWKGKPPQRIKDLFEERTLQMPLAIEARRWLLETAANRPKFVSLHDATERAKICAECPYNIPWECKHTMYDSETHQRILNLRQRVVFTPDKDLRFCDLHSAALKAAVFLRDESLPARSEDAPEACWFAKTASTSFEVK